MIKVAFTAPVSFHTGRIGLSEKQATRRMHCLARSDDKGFFEIMASVVFKAGDPVVIDPGSLPKGFRKLLDPESLARVSELGSSAAEKLAEKRTIEKPADGGGENEPAGNEPDRKKKEAPARKV